MIWWWLTRRYFATVLLTGAAASVTGCGVASPGCTTSTIALVSPASAAADHAATAPGNQPQFTVELGLTAPAGCAVPEIVTRGYAAWTNPEPLAIAISSAQDQSNGLAICLTTTNGPVTLTATTGTGSTAHTNSVALTCK